MTQTSSPPINDDVARALFYGQVFKPEECQDILSLPADRALTQHFETLQRFEMEGYAHYMQAGVELLALDTASRWLYPYLNALFHMLNERHYHFEIAHLMGVQRLILQEGEQIDWHFDVGEGEFSNCKLTLLIWLNSPEMYTGGHLELQVNPGGGIVRPQGTVAIFPAFMANRLTPVTSGKQYLLRAWMHGKRPFC